MKHLIAVVCLFLATSFGLAHGDSQKTPPPDLSGTWVLDSSRSNLGSEIKDYVLTVVHREPEIRFSRKYKRGKREIIEESIYHTDGRPEFGAHQGVNDSLPETRWRGQKLVRRTVSRARGSVDLEIVNYEEWSISPDKQTLTRTMNAAGSGLSANVFFKSKAVFKRLQK
jgi:hypothetical protein